MENKQLKTHASYPWKGFGAFVAIYLLSLAMHFPVLYEQAQVIAEMFGEEIAINPTQYAITALFQPLLLGIIAIYFGHRYVKTVGLRSLINEQLENEPSTGEMKKYQMKDSLPFVITIAVIIAALELGFDFVFQNGLPDLFQPNFTIPTIPQALSSIFYDGLAQEILLRWGVMTSVIYVLRPKGESTNDWSRTIGIVFTAVLFAFAQYSSVAPYVDLSFLIILRILLLTGVSGMLYGWLYATFHIEAAMISHVLMNILVIFGNSMIVGLSTL